MKVTKLTQTMPTPFWNGILKNNWWYLFKCKHLKLSIHTYGHLNEKSHPHEMSIMKSHEWNSSYGMKLYNQLIFNM
jgi:hypothetical protein